MVAKTAFKVEKTKETVKQKAFEDVNANNPTGHANLKSLAKQLHSFNEEAVLVVVEIMRNKEATDTNRLNAAKFITSQLTNVLAQLDRQKLMVKQMKHYEMQIQQADIRNSLLSEELNEIGDDVSKVTFSTELHLVET